LDGDDEEDEEDVPLHATISSLLHSSKKGDELLGRTQDLLRDFDTGKGEEISDPVVFPSYADDVSPLLFRPRYIRL
jgi:hypothetical protein